MTYIAFLRGINVGGHNVKMAELKSIFERLGFSNVRSYINSGNIFFSTDSVDRLGLTNKIEAALRKTLGYEVPTFLRTIEEVEAIIKKEPFSQVELTPDRRFCVVFADEPMDDKLDLPITSSKHDMDIIAIGQLEAFVVWHIINGRPPSGKFTANTLPSRNTSRFYHSLIKILAAAKST